MAPVAPVAAGGEMRKRKAPLADVNDEDPGPSRPPADGAAPSGPRIGLLSEAGVWQHIPLVTTGYRIKHGLGDALRSAFTWHLDTINIWTHAAGFFYYLAVAPQVFDVLSANSASGWERGVFGFYLACACAQMATSALYHWLRCLSPWAESTLMAADVGGITAMIAGSYILGLSLGFSCEPAWILFYLGVLGALLAAANVLSRRPDLSLYYIAMCAAVSWGVVPMGHWMLASYSAAAPIILKSSLGMFGGYAGGMAIFLSRAPERWAPGGGFDRLGASHQLWHVAVWLAGRAWLWGLLEYHSWRAGHGGHTCEGVLQ